MKQYFLTFFCGLALLLTSGCSTFGFGSHSEVKRNSVSSSLVDFLYPNGEIPRRNGDQMPVLELPLRVGIAFVPSRRQSLSANLQNELMGQVKDAFIERPFVEDIQLIPEVYLRSSKGIVGMQQVARMHNVDVMALVSYDQLAISGERESAFLYLTVVGSLMVKGNTHEVQTMVDTAVFDVATGQLLMRAPGQAAGQVNATYFSASQDARSLETQSFMQATDAMVANLNSELEGFRQQVKEGRRATVQWQEGRSGGGSIGGAVVLLMVLLLTTALAQMM